VDEPAPAIVSPTGPNTNLPTLGQTMQVRKLSPQEASRGYPVHVRGVVTYWEVREYLHFMQDESAGIYFDLSRLDPRPSFRSGESVEIEGFTGPGDFAPLIIVQKIRALGESPLPVPEPANFRKLMTGAFDSQWISLKGVIRNQWTTTNITTLTLFTGEGTIKINVSDPARQGATTNYVDSVVEVHGVCTTLYDDRRRLTGVELKIPGWSQFYVREATAQDPFSLPVKTVAELFQFQAGTSGLHRTRLMGVTVLRLSDGSFYLQDASGGIQVLPQASTTDMLAGTTVDVVGFPVIVDRLPVLQDTIVKSGKHGTFVEPVDLKADSPLDDNLHGMLVRFQGQIVHHLSRTGKELLSLQFGQSIIDAELDQTSGATIFGELAPDTRVRVTGVYLARPEDTARAQSFQIHLRSETDLDVISRPSWWNLRHTLWASGALAAVLLLALAWVGSLRRQVQQRTQELHREIEHHKSTEELLKAEIVERKRMESEVKKTHQQLLSTSRQAGMAEVATGVLHNVGNVLNSVNVSSNLVTEQVRKSKIKSLSRAADLMKEHSEDLGEFLTNDPKGKQLPLYLAQLGLHLADERDALLTELESLRKNIEHIKEIVAMQQSYAKVVGLVETIRPSELMDDALRMNQEALGRHHVQVSREYDEQLPEITIDKHKALQILVNLISNAKNACDESRRPDKHLSVTVCNGSGRVKFSVRDNGVGIPKENLSRIFNHGFTTRKDGHGFGLHSGAISAKEMGGWLLAHSDGLECGATFTLELPLGSKS
jgi:signal transduction histidine kinase